MVTKEEIKHVAELMRVEAGDYREYVDKVHAMIDYFGILDSAGVDDEAISAREMMLSELREDAYSEFGHDMMDGLHKYRGGYVRAPKMS